MEQNLHADLDRLIRTCECAIRRGDAPNPTTLHTFQQQLVAARDAPTRTETEDTLQTAIQYYRETVPDDAQTTALAELTDHVVTLAGTGAWVDDHNRRAAAEAGDD